MGCCYSFFCKEENQQGGEPHERTHLLVDPVCNSANVAQINNEDYIGHYSDGTPNKTDEQSALNRILQETATNVIDVAALDSHNLQQHEYIERMKQYSFKLQQACANNKMRPRKRICILQDVPAPDKLLVANPISIDDLNLITTAVVEAKAALNEIKVEHKEDLVVPFRIA